MHAIDIRMVKETARRLYPPGHPLREAILGEPDSLPGSQALGKLEAYLRMVLAGR